MLSILSPLLSDSGELFLCARGLDIGAICVGGHIFCLKEEADCTDAAPAADEAIKDDCLLTPPTILPSPSSSFFLPFSDKILLLPSFKKIVSGSSLSSSWPSSSSPWSLRRLLPRWHYCWDWVGMERRWALPFRTQSLTKVWERRAGRIGSWPMAG